MKRSLLQIIDKLKTNRNTEQPQKFSNKRKM